MEGTWCGDCFCLRDFLAVPAKSATKGVEWSQSMGKLTIIFPLQSIAEHASSLHVELSRWQLRVTVDEHWELNEQLLHLNGYLYGEVRRDLCWWVVETVNDECRFIMELSKREHKSWNSLWKIGMHHHQKEHFGGSRKIKQAADDFLIKVKPGRRAQHDSFIMSRESLCVGLDEGQDENHAILRIHLDTDALRKTQEQICIEDLFGVDITDKFVKIFIRGDERSPIVLGALGGICIPDKTHWEIVKAPVLQEDRRDPDRVEFGTALLVRIFKVPGTGKWQKIVTENPLALERQKAPELHDYVQAISRAPSPDRSGWTDADHAKEQKSHADEAFRKSEWRDATVYYSRAIAYTPDDEKLFSNRSACYVKRKEYDKALNDARTCISLNQCWSKGYFRQGQALRGLRRWDDARHAFSEGKFRDPRNPEWDREIEKTEYERETLESQARRNRKQAREADLITELNEATTAAEKEAMVQVAEHSKSHGKSGKEAGELAIKSAELARKRIHELAKQKQQAMMEDDKEPDETPPFRILKEDGSLHGKGFAHTDKGAYYMGMVCMNFKQSPSAQPWIEIWHPDKLRWSQGCSLLRIKVTLPSGVHANEVEVRCSVKHLRIAVGDKCLVEGDFDRQVEPEGEHFAWFLEDEDPPLLDITIDKSNAEVYQTFSYGTLLWNRLFSDDVILGEGLFEADLTDLPPHLLEKFQQEQSRTSARSLDERQRRKKMTDEEIMEETARNWNDEFALHGLPHRFDTNEEMMLDRLRY